jgi:hypothetical protein
VGLASANPSGKAAAAIESPKHEARSWPRWDARRECPLRRLPSQTICATGSTSGKAHRNRGPATASQTKPSVRIACECHQRRLIRAREPDAAFG